MNRDSYLIQSDKERAMLAECDTLDGAVTPLVCEHGHVHLIFDNWTQITLTPEQAETWVGGLYDAAQEAKEADR
jgi:hypothetical protein